jgi:hypothetical protein
LSLSNPSERAVPHPPPTHALLDRCVLLGLLLYALALSLWIIAGGLHVTQEDGYYYLQIARNIARGAGVTFDGAHATNGFHPLWLLCLLPVFLLTSSPENALRAALLLQTLFMLVCVALLYRTVRRFVGPLVGGFAVLLWLLFSYQWLFSGLEFGIYALCLLAVLHVYLGGFATTQPPARLYFRLGLLCGLTFLARLDSLLLAALVAGALGVREWRAGLSRAGVQRLGAFALPVALVVAAYALINLALYGHPLPVSAALKQAWSATMLSADPHYAAQGWLAAKAVQWSWPLSQPDNLLVLTLVLGAWVVPALWLVARFVPGWRVTQLPWQPFLAFSVLNFTAYALLLHGTLVRAPWYYAIQPLLTALFAAALVEALPKRWLGPLVLAVLWLAIPLYTARSIARAAERQADGSLPEPLWVAAQWAQANVPPDALVASWNAGTIGFWSGRRVINLDGVVNSWSFFESERFDLCRYWQQNGVTVLLDAFEDKQALSTVPTIGAYVRCVDRLDLLWSANPYHTDWHIEAYRFRPTP